MATARPGAIRDVFDRLRGDAGGDGELLARYRTLRDQDAFGSLVRRHGPMVLGVCRRMLRNHSDADDAFQATFLVLAKKADAVRPPDRLAPWLYGVAFRTALKARGRVVRRAEVELAYAAEVAARGEPNADAADLLPVIDEHLNALPGKYRLPLVLCGVQGLNKAEAAAKLGLPEGTVSSRLARAREMLRDRLTRRGIAVPAAALATLLTADALQAAVPPALAEAAAAGTASATVLTLSNEVIRSMTLLKPKLLVAAALVLSLAAGGFGLAALTDDQKPPPAEKPAATPQKPRPDGDKPKPAAGDEKKPQPDSPRPEPRKNRRSVVGLVGAVDADGRTVTLLRMGEGGLREDAFRVQADAKVVIDGIEAKLADVPKGVTADLTIASFGKDGSPAIASEVWVDGSKLVWVVKSADAASVTLLGGGRQSKLPDRVVKLDAGTKVLIDGKAAKPTDLQAGDMATVVLNADRTAATAVTVRTRGEPDREKPKPEEPEAARPTDFFLGRVAAVNAIARTITIDRPGAKDRMQEIVIPLAADAEVIVDRGPGPLGAIPAGALAHFEFPALPGFTGGRPVQDPTGRIASRVRVSGGGLQGVIKQIDATGITITSKQDRTFKLPADVVVGLDRAAAKAADLRAGDALNATLSADRSAVLSINACRLEYEAGQPPRLRGPVWRVNAEGGNRGIDLFDGKGGATSIRLTPDAKITIDGKDAKVTDLTKGMTATFAVPWAKDGKPWESNEVVATSPPPKKGDGEKPKKDGE